MKRVAALICALLILLCACNSAPAGLGPADKEVLNVCLGAFPATLDPARVENTADGSVALHLFEGLYVLGDNFFEARLSGKPVLGQAESCEVSENGMIYSFTLRADLKWSDGKALTARDFIYAWNRAASMDNAHLFDVIDRERDGSLSLEAPDDRTLVVILRNYTEYFLELLALPAFCPVRRDMVELSPSGWSLRTGTCVGNGAYTLSGVAEDSYVKVEKNSHYRDAAAVKTKVINFANISEGSAYDAYMAGDILFADSVPSGKLAGLGSRDDIYLQPLPGTYYLVFNTKKAPFDKKLVRQALTIAIDREYISNEICQGVNTPADSFIPLEPGEFYYPGGAAGHRWNHKSERPSFAANGGGFFDISDYASNLEAAGELLEEAGYGEEKEFPVINYTYNEGTEHMLIAEAVQHMWAELGVTLSPKAVSRDKLLSFADAGDFQIIRSGWMCDFSDPVSMLSIFASNSPRNFSGWSSKAYDKSLNAAASMSDFEERAQELLAAEELLFEDWVVCPLFYYSDVFIMSPYLEGVAVSSLGYKSFVFAEIK